MELNNTVIVKFLFVEIVFPLDREREIYIYIIFIYINSSNFERKKNEQNYWVKKK